MGNSAKQSLWLSETVVTTLTCSNGLANLTVGIAMGQAPEEVRNAASEMTLSEPEGGLPSALATSTNSLDSLG